MLSEDPSSKVPIPNAKYFEQATSLTSQFDRLMVTLYSGLIAGIAVLLLKSEVSVWVGAFLSIALILFVLGIGHSLLHIAFHTKMLLALEAIVNGVEHLPSPLDSEAPTVEAYARMRQYAQRAYSGQLVYMGCGMVFSAVGVLLRLWEYSWRGGVVLAVVFGVVLCSLLAIRVWRKPRIPSRDTSAT